MSSTTLLNDLMHKANLDFYSQETLMLIRKFIYSSYRLFSLSKRPAQTDSEFDPILSVRIDNVLIDFYLLHQRLFIELKFSSFRDVVDYFQGIQFHPCFECFDFLLQVPNLMSGLSVDEKQQVILKKEHIPYLLLKQFYTEHRVKMLKRIRDYEQVEKKGYEKALGVYRQFKQKVLDTEAKGVSLYVSTKVLTLELKSFASFALVLSEIQCIYKVFNRWAKDTNTILIRKLMLNIEKASISINMLALGSGQFNDMIKMDLLNQSLKQPPINKPSPCILTTGQNMLSLNQKIQGKAQKLWDLLGRLKQKQYTDPEATETLNNAMGSLAQLTDYASLIRKVQQLQALRRRVYSSQKWLLWEQCLLLQDYSS